eukprot:TRINITY_DN1629_c0_g1_i1.p1 TRINITY_DN1629_c0_g1~~TRINITY_DN1629_c0_g1_i1.p1  ORF type:complete len:613 (+),score=108.90 TRINITY_DN1629_c0_g1_i1:228-2066(+)
MVSYHNMLKKVFTPVSQSIYFRFNLIDFCLVVGFLLLNYLYIMLRGVDLGDIQNLFTVESLSKMKGTGKDFGYLIHFNLLFLLIPVSRRGIINTVLQISFERLIKYHRWIGRWLVVITSFHFAIFISYWYHEDGTSKVISETFTHTSYLYGFIAFMFNLIILITSWELIRRKFYGFFLSVHIISFIGYLIFSVLHKKGADELVFIIIPLIIFVLDILYRYYYQILFNKHYSLWNLISKKNIQMEKYNTGFNILNISEEYNEGILRGKPLILNYYDTFVIIKMKRPESFIYKPGQYVNLYIPDASMFSIHPFSLVSHPYESDFLMFVIQPVGKFTKKLLKMGTIDLNSSSSSSSYNSSGSSINSYQDSHSLLINNYDYLANDSTDNFIYDMDDEEGATSEKLLPILSKSNHQKVSNLHESHTIRFEGPYGTLSIQNPHKYRIAVFVAGGSGITPLIALIQDVLAKNQIAQGVKPITIIKLIWSTRSSAYFLAFKQLLLTLKQYSQTNEYDSDAEYFDIQLHQTKGHLTDTEENIIQVKHDLDIIEGTRPSISNSFLEIKSQASLLDVSTIGVYCCGPNSLRKDCRIQTLRNNHSCFSFTSKISFHLHEESYEI